MQTILITKNENEVKALKHFCELASYNFIAQSFIDFKPVNSVISVHYDWIFFGSKRSVDFFFKQHRLLVNCKVACIGATTAKQLLSLGISPDFIGEFAGDARAVALALQHVVGSQFLLIPISSRSEHSIASVFESTACQEVVVYETVLKPIQLTIEPTVLLFTSPSNVEGFLQQNAIPLNALIIAWGKTTEKHLRNKGYSVTSVLKTANIEEIPTLLSKLIS